MKKFRYSEDQCAKLTKEIQNKRQLSDTQIIALREKWDTCAGLYFFQVDIIKRRMILKSIPRDDSLVRAFEAVLSFVEQDARLHCDLNRTLRTATWKELDGVFCDTLRRYMKDKVYLDIHETVRVEIVRRYLQGRLEAVQFPPISGGDAMTMALGKSLGPKKSAEKPAESRFVERLLEIWCEATETDPAKISPGHQKTPGPLLRYFIAATEPVSAKAFPRAGLCARATQFRNAHRL